MGSCESNPALPESVEDEVIAASPDSPPVLLPVEKKNDVPHPTDDVNIGLKTGPVVFKNSLLSEHSLHGRSKDLHASVDEAKNDPV